MPLLMTRHPWPPSTRISDHGKTANENVAGAGVVQRTADPGELDGSPCVECASHEHETPLEPRVRLADIEALQPELIRDSLGLAEFC
jgi:hypothetical protein